MFSDYRTLVYFVDNIQNHDKSTTPRKFLLLFWYILFIFLYPYLYIFSLFPIVNHSLDKLFVYFIPKHILYLFL